MNLNFIFYITFYLGLINIRFKIVPPKDIETNMAERNSIHLCTLTDWLWYYAPLSHQLALSKFLKHSSSLQFQAFCIFSSLCLEYSSRGSIFTLTHHFTERPPSTFISHLKCHIFGEDIYNLLSLVTFWKLFTSSSAYCIPFLSFKAPSSIQLE